MHKEMWNWFHTDELIDTIILIMEQNPHLETEFAPIFPTFSKGHF